MTSKDECLHYAAECVALAQRASDAADKAHLLRMAQAWRDLAEKQSAQAKNSDTV